MFNFLLLVSTITVVFGHFHLGQGRNEEVLNTPVIMLRCRGSISPRKRNILSQKILSESELAFIQGLFKTARKEKYAFVCCEYFLQTDDGRTVGILMDNDQGLALGFDLGIKMNAKETHTERFHNMRIIRNRADQKRLYSLVHELFPGAPKDL